MLEELLYSPDFWTLACLSYLIGSVPSGVIVSSLMKTKDPRTIGSGNIGATNMLRTGSKKAAIYTLIGDIIKGSIPTLGGLFWGKLTLGLENENNILPLIAMLFAILGHCFPLWLKFKGGKGVATYIGALAALPAIGFIALVAIVWISIAAISRYVSLASIASVIAVIPYSYLLFSIQHSSILTIIALIIIIQHRENISRLVKGNENKLKL